MDKAVLDTDIFSEVLKRKNGTVRYRIQIKSHDFMSRFGNEVT